MTSAPNTACVRTSDVDQLAENVRPWDMRFTQLTPGRLEGVCDAVECGEWIFYRERWSHRMLANGASPLGYIMLGYGRHAVWCGKTVEPGCLALAAPGSEVDFLTPDHSDHAVVLIPKEHVERVIPGESLETLSERRHLTLDILSQRSLAGLVRRCVAHPELLRVPRAAETFQSTLLHWVAKGLGAHSVLGKDAGHPASWRTVRRALEYLDASDGAMTMPELARGSGVSQRTMELAFRSALGISPLRFNRLRLLMSAHRELCAAEPPQTVADIAGRCGFTELGRFAGQYRAVFGEYPLNTLRRRSVGHRLKLADILV